MSTTRQAATITHPNEIFRRQRGHIETLQGQVKNLQATNLNLLFKVVFGVAPDLDAAWAYLWNTGRAFDRATPRAYRVRKEQA